MIAVSAQITRTFCTFRIDFNNHMQMWQSYLLNTVFQVYQNPSDVKHMTISVTSTVIGWGLKRSTQGRH